MNRRQAIKKILKESKDAIIVSTDGLISREVYDLRKRKVFPMVGSMGLAPSIGLGIALNTNKEVIIINGDGSFLMSAGTQQLINYYHLPNLKHFILDNEMYETTGNQKCIPIKADGCSVIKIKKGGEKPPRIKELKKIKKCFL